MGGAPKVSAPQAPDAAAEYKEALQAYTQNAPALYQEEATYQPLYNRMQQQIMGQNINVYSRNIEQEMPGWQAAINRTQDVASAGALQNYAKFAGPAGAYALASSPQLQQLAQYGQAQLGAGQDPVLRGILGQIQQQAPGQQQQLTDLAARAGRMFDPTNRTLQAISGQVGAGTGQAVQSLQNIAAQAAANQRTPMFQQTAANVMGQLGNLDPLTQQLSTMAQGELALGGNISAQEAQDVAQQARAAFSARGMMGQSGSIAAEVLQRSMYQQQRLAQRQQFASGVSGLVQQETQQRTANAMGLTQADIAATQANQQLAGQLYQAGAGVGQAGAQIQGSLQGQIASNLAQASQQQGALTQQAIQNAQANQQLQAGLQGSILDQLYRQQSAGAGALQSVYGAQQNAIGAIVGAPPSGAQLASQVGMGVPGFGTGSPNLFQGSGLLSLVNQNRMAQMNATAAANQMNAQSAGAAQGATMGMIGTVGSALIGGVALL